MYRVHGPYTAVYGPFAAVYGRVTAVYTCIRVHEPCTRPLHGRVLAVYTAENDRVHGSLHGPYTAVSPG